MSFEKYVELEHISFSYIENDLIFEDLNLSISDKETIGVIGANGAGKSTLLKLLTGLYNPTAGEITICDEKRTKETLENHRKKIGYVFQDSESQLFMSTVYDDVAFGPRNYGCLEDEVERRVNEALEKVGISDLAKRHIYRMSGGQKKLASIATILSMEPEILLLDEPSITLDPRNRRNLINILNDMQVTKIIATHDLDMILDTCDRTILISNGKIVKDGRTKDVLEDEKLLLENGLELPLSLQKAK